MIHTEDELDELDALLGTLADAIGSGSKRQSDESAKAVMALAECGGWWETVPESPALRTAADNLPCDPEEADKLLAVLRGIVRFRKAAAEAPELASRCREYLALRGKSWKVEVAETAAPPERTAKYLGDGRILIDDETPALLLNKPHIPVVERLLKGFGVASTSELEKVASNPARTFKEISEGYAGKLAPFFLSPDGKSGYSTTVKDCRQVVAKS